MSLVAAFALASCSGPTGEAHYRVTVNLLDHGVARSGSAVWGERISKPPIHLINTYASKFTGEAIPISLPGRGVVFVLPTGPGESTSGIWALLTHYFMKQDPRIALNNVELMRAIAGRKGTTYQAECDYKLTDVSGDPSIYSEMARANGSRSACPNLAFSSKPEVQRELHLINYNELRSLTGEDDPIANITVTVTDDPVTSRIRNMLPWLDNAPLDPNTYEKKANDQFMIVR